MRRCVVAVVAHPDDEAYAAAGLLARCARAGARVVVVSATRGEGGRDRAGELEGAALAERRSRELAESCAAIGAEAPRFLGLSDGAVHAEDGVETLTELLDELAADLVVTLGPDGAYGHVDHLATTAMVAAAARGRVLHAAFEPGLFAPLHRRLRRFPFVADVPLGSRDADLVVDLTDEERRAKEAALAAHASQLADGEPRSFLLPDLVLPLLARERFVVAAGAPLPRDATLPWEGLP